LLHIVIDLLGCEEINLVVPLIFSLMQQLSQELEQDEIRSFRHHVGSPVTNSPPGIFISNYFVFLATKNLYAYSY
jgi:hypothetical protein